MDNSGKKCIIVGHGSYSQTLLGPLLNHENVFVKVINNDPDQNIIVTGDLLKASTYDLTTYQYPITRAQRRKTERNKKKRK